MTLHFPYSTLTFWVSATILAAVSTEAMLNQYAVFAHKTDFHW